MLPEHFLGQMYACDYRYRLTKPQIWTLKITARRFQIRAQNPEALPIQAVYAAVTLSPTLASAHAFPGHMYLVVPATVERTKNTCTSGRGEYLATLTLSTNSVSRYSQTRTTDPFQLSNHGCRTLLGNSIKG